MKKKSEKSKILKKMNFRVEKLFFHLLKSKNHRPKFQLLF
jgi:hypothetical protein